MNKTELEKAIKNGDSVWAYDDLLHRVIPYKANEIAITGINTNMPAYELKDLFATKQQAEHYLHHANITRTERLPFLTWEEFSKINIKDIEFTDKKLNLYNLSGFGKIKLYRNIDTADETLLLELEATEQNFYKAYDECVRLFKNE